MLYVLHHKKGALLLAAEDRDQVIRWSQRQLGKEAGLVSISEKVCMDADHSVERDGTGIGTVGDKGCHPVMGILANLAQDVHVEQGCSESQDALIQTALPVIKQPTWH